MEAAIASSMLSLSIRAGTRHENNADRKEPELRASCLIRAAAAVSAFALFIAVLERAAA